MTKDGGDGAAADCQPEAQPRRRAPRRHVINRDDDERVSRYIEPAYPHTRTGPIEHPRRERQVAAALRNDTALVIVEPFRAVAGPADGRRRPLLRMR